MDRIERTWKIKSPSQIPSLESIRAIPRDWLLKLVFVGKVQEQRAAIGLTWRAELAGFEVRVLSNSHEIHIVKLITDAEIDENWMFFERCAKDYRQLARELIFNLADHLDVSINPSFPLLTFNPIKQNRRQSGTLGDWRYFLHGFHCGFKHKTTGQVVETPLTFGLEFGVLDPSFFINYIRSTNAYKPLPLWIFDEHVDGERILERMCSLGKFERISSNVPKHEGIVVTDRTKIHIEVYQRED